MGKPVRWTACSHVTVSLLGCWPQSITDCSKPTWLFTPASSPISVGSEERYLRSTMIWMAKSGGALPGITDDILKSVPGIGEVGRGKYPDIPNDCQASYPGMFRWGGRPVCPPSVLYCFLRRVRRVVPIPIARRANSPT
jgi:hypothetical protein